MRNNLVIFFIILFTYFSQMSNSKADCPIHEGINIKDSFGIQICSMPGVDNKYLLHAKKVMDNLLDYEDDEFPDNQLVIENIMRTGSVFVIFNTEREIRNFEEIFYIGVDEIIEGECEELSDRECDNIIENKHGIFLAVFKDVEGDNFLILAVSLITFNFKLFDRLLFLFLIAFKITFLSEKKIFLFPIS